MNRLKMRFQIGMSFSALIIMMVLVSVTSLLGLRFVYKEFVEYRTLARVTNFSNEIQGDLSAMKLAVKDFLNTHADGDIAEFQNHNQLISERLRSFDIPIERLSSASNFKKLTEMKNQYADAAEKIFEAIKSEDELISSMLEPAGLTMRQDLSSIMQSAFNDDDAIAAYYAGRAQEQLLLGRRYMTQFILKFDPQYYERVSD